MARVGAARPGSARSGGVVSVQIYNFHISGGVVR